LLGYLVGGYVPELKRQAGHTSAASAVSLRRAFLVMAVLEVISCPWWSSWRLAAFAGQRGAAGADVAQRRLARFLRVRHPAALLGIGAGMLLNFLQLYLAQRFN